MLGCANRAVPPAPLPELVAGSAYDEHVAPLRATLARNRIALDTAPVVTTCTEHHGVTDCARCEVASREDTRGIDPDLIDEVAIAFAHYPTNVLMAAKLEHVALCRTIRYDHPHGLDPLGMAIVDDERLMISIEHHDGELTLAQIVHHEVFHLIDHAMLGDKAAADAEWSALNPRTFAYADPAPETELRPAGFVNAYATTNEREDRASVWEYVMGQPEALCEITAADPMVAAKVRLVRARIGRLMGTQRLPNAHCTPVVKSPMPSPIPLGPRRRMSMR